MIIGRDSLKKGALLFVGAASIITCVFTAFASEEPVLQDIAVVGLISVLAGAYKIYKGWERE